MAEFDDDKPIKIPKKLRVSTDKTDAEAFARLLASDEYQKELAERFQIKAETPKERERSRALIVVQTLSNQFLTLSLDQIEQLSEAYATLGEYKTAKRLTLNSDKKAEYQAIFDAVYLPDDEWCQHPERHIYQKDLIYSVRDNKEVPLFKCNICGQLNTIKMPKHIEEGKQRRASMVANAPKNISSIQESIRWHKQNIK